MKLLTIMFEMAPVVSIGAVVLIIISLCMKDTSKKSNVCFYIGLISIVMYILVLMGFVFPYAILSAIFKDNTGIIGVVAFVSMTWLIISSAIQLKNKFIIWKNNEKEIYVRDIKVEYSPAVLSYLMNNKIETQKDLSATLLNLCANNVLKIQKDENGKVCIIDLKNNKEVEKLSPDEKYAYEMLISKITRAKISKWKNMVTDEYEKYKFSNEHKTSLSQYVIILYILLFVIALIASMFNVSNILNTFIAYLIPIAFFSISEIIIFSGIRGMIRLSEKTEFVDMYTRKGAIEYSRWKKFEKFIEEYTLIKDKNYEHIVILGKYLSYSIALGINKKCDTELYNEVKKCYLFDEDLLKTFSKDKIE